MSLSDDIYWLGGRCDLCGGRIFVFRVLGDRALGRNVKGRHVTGSFYAAHSRCYTASLTALRGTEAQQQGGTAPTAPPPLTFGEQTIEGLMDQAKRMADEIPMDRMGATMATDVLRSMDRLIDQSLTPGAGNTARFMMTSVASVIAWTAGRQFSIEAFRGRQADELFSGFASRLIAGVVERTLVKSDDGTLMQFDAARYIEQSISTATASTKEGENILPMVDAWASRELKQYSAELQRPSSDFIAGLRKKAREQCYATLIFKSGNL